MLYFRLLADKSNRAAYLLVSAEGNAYVAVFDRAKNVRLFDLLGGLKKNLPKTLFSSSTTSTFGIPLMERDDTKKDGNLRALAAAYTQDYGFDSQPYAVFLNKINRGELKIKQWK